MSWGRIDDGFTRHRKVLALGSKARRWTWLEVLSYTWEYRSPIVPEEIRVTLRDATPAFLADCEKVGLIDRDEQGRRVVHDWPLYSDAPLREKVDYVLARHPDMSANDVHRMVGGTRNAVLAEVRRYRGEPHDAGSVVPPFETSPQVRPNRGSGLKSGTDPSPPQDQDLNPVFALSLSDTTSAKNGGIDGLETGENAYELVKLAAAIGATNGDQQKLERAAKGKPLARIIDAREAATSEGVRDRVAVALHTLKNGRPA